MGGNPRYRQWNRENWQGYAPTIGHMVDQGWRLTAHCSCGLNMNVSIARMAEKRGRSWSPWGTWSPCPRIGCHARMHFQAHTGRADFQLWL